MVVAAGFALKSPNPLFEIFVQQKMVVAAGFEPAIAWMKTMCPRPLDDATTCVYYSKNSQKVQA